MRASEPNSTRSGSTANERYGSRAREVPCRRRGPKRRRVVVWRRRNPMDTQRTNRKHRHWIASVAFVASLAGASTGGAQPCVITFPGAPPSDGTVGMAYQQGISGSSPYLLISY